jgi:hypothetical protein
MFPPILWQLIPPTLPDPVETSHLASVLGHPQWFAQKVAYCIRAIAKKATRLYTPASRRQLDRIVRQLAVRVPSVQCPAMVVQPITPRNASTRSFSEVLNGGAGALWTGLQLSWRMVRILERIEVP